MPVTLSPTVNTRVIDFSSFISDASATVLGCIGGAEKGPLNEPTLCTSPQDFIRKFGNPTPESKATYSAIQFLQEGDQLFFVRVSGTDSDDDETAKEAELTITDGADTDPTDVLVFEAVSPGEWGNDIAINIVDVENNDADDDTVFDVEVVYDDNVEETYNDCTLVPDSDLGDFIEDVIDEDTSDYVVSEVLVDEDSEIEETDEDEPQSLSGGENGISDIESEDVVGDISEKTGLQIFRDYDKIHINVLIAPDRSSHEAVATELLDIAEYRGDTLTIIDPPRGLSTQEVVDWHNGEDDSENAPSQTINSEYGVIYYPWIEIYDGINGRDVWIPPSGMVAGIWASTDQDRGRWFAPAGFKRGRLTRALDIEYSPDKGERDLMYAYDNAINPIVNFSGEGITVWGQRTLLRQNSAKNRVNVMRLLLMIRKAIAGTTKYLVFDQNDEALWRNWKGMVRPYLDGLENDRALYDFEIEMGEETMTVQDVDENKLNGRVYIQPTKAAEFITIDFILQRSEAVFE